MSKIGDWPGAAEITVYCEPEDQNVPTQKCLNCGSEECWMAQQQATDPKSGLRFKLPECQKGIVVKVVRPEFLVRLQTEPEEPE